MQDASVRGHALAPGTVRRILKFAVPYRVHLTVFLGLLAVDAAVGAATPLLYRVIIDVGIGEGRKDVVMGTAALAVLLAVCAAAIALAQRWITARIGEGLIFDLRTAVFDHVQSLPVAFFSRTQTGALIQRLNGDVLGAQQAFTLTLSNVIGNLLGVGFVIAAMFFLSWQLTLLALALLPLFLLPAWLIAPRLRRLTSEQFRLNGEMGQTMTEHFNVAGAVLAKVFGRNDDASRRFAGHAGQVRDIGVTQSMYAGVFRVSLTLVAALAVALVYGVGGTLSVGGALGIGTLVALTAYLTRLYAPLTALSNVQVDIMTTLVSFERVLEVLDLPPMVADRPDARALAADAEPSIELDDVSFSYPPAAAVSLASLESVGVLSGDAGAEVLHQVSFRVEPGQMVALVGPSGAGKTTITALVARLYDATSGSVRVGGVDVRAVTQRSLRDRIGVVTQDAHMFHDTIRANLALARPDASEGDMRDALRAARIDSTRRVAARRARHCRRRARLSTVGRRTPAPGHRAGPAQGPGHHPARRGDRAPGLGVGGRDPAGPGHRAGRAHLPGGGASPLHCARRGSDPRPRRWPAGRARHPRRAAGPRGTVRRAVPDAVRAARRADCRSRRVTPA